MSRHRQIRSKSDNHELTVQDHETDSPVIPVAQIQLLHQFRPDRVDWVFDQTERESEARRTEAKRVNTFIFVERILGTLFAFCLGGSGLLGAIWLAHDGHEIAASV